MRAGPEIGRSRWRWLRYLLGGMLLAGLLYLVPVRDIWDALRAARVQPLAGALAAVVIGRWIASKRTQILTDHQGLSLSARRIFEIGCAGTLYGLAVPVGFSGGVVRWYRLAQPDGQGSRALVVVMVERAVDFLALAALGVLCWLADPARDGLPSILWALVAVVALCLLLCLGIFSPLSVPAGRCLRGLVGHRRWLPDRVRDVVVRIAAAFGEYESLGAGRMFTLLALSVAVHGILTGSQYLMAHSLGLGLSVLSLGWIRASIVLLTAFPITPSGLGVREFGLLVLLSPFGITNAEAVAFSLLLFAGLLLMALIGLYFEVRTNWQSAGRGGGPHSRHDSIPRTPA